MVIFLQIVNTIKAKTFILPLGGLKWKSKEARNNKNSKNKRNKKSKDKSNNNPKNKKDSILKKNHRASLNPYGFFYLYRFIYGWNFSKPLVLTSSISSSLK